MQPIEDRVVIIKDNKTEMSDGGIYIPGAAQEPSIFGTVIAVGPGKLSKNGNIIPMTVKIDDKVLFGFQEGNTIIIKGQELLVMRESDIIAILDKEECPE